MFSLNVLGPVPTQKDNDFLWKLEQMFFIKPYSYCWLCLPLSLSLNESYRKCWRSPAHLTKLRYRPFYTRIDKILYLVNLFCGPYLDSLKVTVLTSTYVCRSIRQTSVCHNFLTLALLVSTFYLYKLNKRLSFKFSCIQKYPNLF